MLLKTHPDLAREDIEARVAQANEAVVAAGGLFVIGTERHDSRRIDNQLRGRSGRQGDPGRSKFFISLEDDLIKGLGIDRMSNILGKLGMDSGESIEHPWVSRAIEKAQQRVEARNYEVRKNLVKYDDAIDKQRRLIFEQRNKVIDSDREIEGTFDSMRVDVNHNLINKYIVGWDESTVQLAADVKEVYGLEIDFADHTAQTALQLLNDETAQLFAAKKEHCNPDLIASIQKYIWLTVLDTLWREHLLLIDALRQSISLRAMGQKDPFNEFAMETFRLFSTMMNNMQRTAVSRFAMVRIQQTEQVTGDEEEY
jgi:preprotein translocase subunit SecA